MKNIKLGGERILQSFLNLIILTLLFLPVVNALTCINCPDINSDGVVDDSDKQYIISFLETYPPPICSGEEGYNPKLDITGDHCISAEDLACVSNAVGYFRCFFSGCIEPEICDGKDNDCNGISDDGLGQTTCGLGECDHIIDNCVGGVMQICDPFEGASAEICDNKDNDCDGRTDEDFPNKGLSCSVGKGLCQRTGTYVCKADGSGTECSATPGTPAAEICDGLDNDCDDSIADDGIDETWYNNPTSCGVGECLSSGNLVCTNGAKTDTCIPGTPATEICDGKDNDCDGLIDNIDTDDDGISDCFDNCPSDAGSADDILIDDPDHPCYGCPESKCTNLVYYNKKFHTCNILLEYVGLTTDNAENNSFCEPIGDWYCNIDNKWKKQDPTHPKNTKKFLPESDSDFACCNADQCWNGTSCASSTDSSQSAQQANTFTHNINHYRCIGGQWEPALLKYDYDHLDDGWCSADQCYANRNCIEKNYYINGTKSSNICIRYTDKINCTNSTKTNEETGKSCSWDNTNDYCYETAASFCKKDYCYPKGDYYCKNGNWTTRTKLIALKLLKYAESKSEDDYTLYCDNYTNVLNYFDQSDGSNDKLALNNINNICGLRTENNVLLGFSLNVDVSDQSESILKSLPPYEAGFCNNVEDADFNVCDNTNKILYYNNLTNSIIYSKEEVDIELGFLNSLLQSIINFFTGSSRPSYNYLFIKNSTKFNKLYISKLGGKEIKGIMEKVGNRYYMAVEYTDIDFNISKFAPPEAEFEYSSIGNTQYRYIKSISKQDVAFQYWQDLTSRIRLKNE